MKEDGKWSESLLPRADYPFKSPIWDEEDKDLMLVIKQVCHELYKNPPNKQIKRYTILTLLSSKDKARIINYRDKLPRSMDILDRHLESLVHYQLRQIPIALYRKHYGNAALPMILNERKYESYSQTLKDCIQEHLRSNE